MNAVIEAKQVVANVVNEEIMALIKQERKKRGWSYEELGNRLGVSASYMFRLEKGQRQNPSTKVLKSLCELFDIDPNQVMLMEPNIIKVGNLSIEMPVIQELFEFILNTNTEKTGEVFALLERISAIQKEYSVK
jgi:transcriptional regulator with XRE-family HTH domain